MREARSDAELDERIYSMGDFGKIMNAAKRTLPCHLEDPLTR